MSAIAPASNLSSQAPPSRTTASDTRVRRPTRLRLIMPPAPPASSTETSPSRTASASQTSTRRRSTRPATSTSNPREASQRETTSRRGRQGRRTREHDSFTMESCRCRHCFGLNEFRPLMMADPMLYFLYYLFKNLESDRAPLAYVHGQIRWWQELEEAVEQARRTLPQTLNQDDHELAVACLREIQDHISEPAHREYVREEIEGTLRAIQRSIIRDSDAQEREEIERERYRDETPPSFDRIPLFSSRPMDPELRQLLRSPPGSPVRTSTVDQALIDQVWTGPESWHQPREGPTLALTSPEIVRPQPQRRRI